MPNEWNIYKKLKEKRFLQEKVVEKVAGKHSGARAFLSVKTLAVLCVMALPDSWQEACHTFPKTFAYTRKKWKVPTPPVGGPKAFTQRTFANSRPPVRGPVTPPSEVPSEVPSDISRRSTGGWREVSRSDLPWQKPFLQRRFRRKREVGRSVSTRPISYYEMPYIVLQYGLYCTAIWPISCYEMAYVVCPGETHALPRVNWEFTPGKLANK